MKSSIVAPLALSALLVLAACDQAEPGEIPPPATPVEVEVSRPAATAAVSVYTGSLVAVQRADLATRTSGTIERVRVDVGAAVRAGEVLLSLDDASTEAQIEGAQAGLRQATRRFERIEALAADGAATDQELDDARAALETARAHLASARSQQAYVTLRAPFSGYVSARHADPGDLAAPGRPLLTVVGTDSLKVVTDLPARWGGRIDTGDVWAVVLPDGDRRRAGRVVHLSPAVDAASRRMRVELVLSATDAATSGLRPGDFVRVEVPEPGTRSLWIPTDAVVQRGQLRGVFLVDGEELRLRWIRLGEQRGDAVEVLAGLPDDARIVRSPGVAFVDGTALRSAVDRTWSAPTVEDAQ